MSARSIVSASPIVSVVLALGCAPGGDTNTNVTEKAGGPPPVVTLMATDYAYEAPGTVSAGFTVFRLVNRGDEFHGATIVRLEPGLYSAGIHRCVRRGAAHARRTASLGEVPWGPICSAAC